MPHDKYEARTDDWEPVRKTFRFIPNPQKPTYETDLQTIGDQIKEVDRNRLQLLAS